MARSPVSPVMPASPAPAHPTRGRIVGQNEAGQLLVDFNQNPHGPLPADSLKALSPDRVERAIAGAEPAMLLFEDGDLQKPLLLGLVEAPQLQQEVHLRADAPKEAIVDGRRVVLCASDEIELVCGKAKIVLRRNGKVIIRGTYVETQSSGTNRIKGGSVAIN